jgi:hypothetical protein
LLDILDVLIDHPVEPWVHAAYMSKFERLMTGGFFLHRVTDDHYAQIERAIMSFPEGPDMVSNCGHPMYRFLRGRLDAHPEKTESREFLDRLLKEREKKGFDY